MKSRISRKQFIGGAAVATAAALSPVVARMLDGVVQTGGLPPEGMSNLIPAVSDLIARSRIPGLSLAIVSETGDISAWGFGVGDAETNDPVATATVFQATSLSKPVFAYGVLGLVERKILDLDESLSTGLPKSWIRKEPRLGVVTPRMVLSHTSGIAGHLDSPTFHFDPGERFEYSPLGFQFLQVAVERRTGEALPELMRQNVLGPLGMRSSSFRWTLRHWWAGAKGHFENGRPRGNSVGLGSSAAGSLLTTAEDYARFMAEILKPAGKKSRHRISESLKAEMLRPQVRVADGIAWGLGWGLEDPEYIKTFWHWGDQDIFKNLAVADLRRGSAIVILTNSSNGSRAYPEIVSRTIGGRHPALSWIANYRG